MKKKLLLVITCYFIVSSNLLAQYICTPGGRYDAEIFSSVNVTSNIVYGSAKTVSNVTQSLVLDIYEPVGDTASKRPLILLAHGGSFIGGTKTDGDVVALCNRFAKRGYVCVSYEYRLGLGLPIDQARASRAVYRATQDAKAAVRYFRKDAATSNTYKIDPNYVYLGGSSAGAFIALHYAYLDQQAEVPSYLDTAGLGEIDGTSGNPGYNADVNAIINLCGALGNVSWMHVGDEPLCNMHGTDDQTVPYLSEMLYISGVFPIMVVDGSHTIDSVAKVLGIDDTLHTWLGADHVPYAGSAAYMDSTVLFVSEFLCRQNAKGSTIGIQNKTENSELFVYPIPSRGEINVRNLAEEKIKLELMDVCGRVLYRKEHSESLISIHPEIPAGIYFLNLIGNANRKTQKIVIY